MKKETPKTSQRPITEVKNGQIKPTVNIVRDIVADPKPSVKK